MESGRERSVKEKCHFSYLGNEGKVRGEKVFCGTHVKNSLLHSSNRTNRKDEGKGFDNSTLLF